MVISIDPTLLVNYYLAQAGILPGGSSTSGVPTASSANTPAAPTPPWNAVSSSSSSSSTSSSSTGAPTTPAVTLANQVLNGQNIINPNAAKLDVPNASSDYQSLFTAYQGLNALEGMTEEMLASGATTTGNARIAKTFNAGLGQVSSYIDSLSLNNLRLTVGSVSSKDATSIAPAAETDSYTTGTVYVGDQSSPVPAFEGNVQFNININKFNKTNINVPIDLSQLGTTPRTIANVVNYINSQLKAAGVNTRFSTSRTVGTAQTIQVGSQTVTLAAAPDQWALKISGDSSEAVTFSAASTAPAVYVAQTAGNTLGLTGTTPPIQQLLKFQDDAAATATPPPSALAQPGSVNAVAGEAFSKTLDPNVGAVHATATGPDGSVYVVADVTGAVAGQSIQGQQDVALLKYDSAGKLAYARTLGASSSASGYAIAVSSAGKVAVAGSVTGALDPTQPGNNPTGADSFVTVYDAQGQESWTQLRGSLQNTQANAVAFGADGSVYVAGQVSGTLPGATAVGGQDGYLQGFSSTGKALFASQFGTTGTDKATALAVDGNTVVVAGTDSTDGVLRSFALQPSGAPTLTATRDLGALNGGSINGVAINNGQVIVAGTTSNGALSAGTITSAASGGQDAFVAQLSETLAPATADRLAYFGGSGQDSATALTVSGGQIYIAGSSTDGLQGLPKLGNKQGYVASVDVNAGTLTWAKSFSGQDGYAAPTSIAVDATGASVLDRLGLPKETLQYTSSQLLTAATSVRAGDTFQIRTSAGSTPATVTIDATDTPTTLETKIQRAAGFAVTVTVTPSAGENRVVITPESDHNTVELLPGKPGQDALGPLGLAAGVIQTASALGADNPSSSPYGIAKNTYGLGIAGAFDLTTTAGIKAAQATLKKALAKVQTAYYDLANGNKPKTTASTNTSANGPVPAYLQAELANYQAGLARLTGSTSGSSSLAQLF